MFDFWPVYSGEGFRASWPSCFITSGPVLAWFCDNVLTKETLLVKMKLELNTTKLQMHLHRDSAIAYLVETSVCDQSEF